MVRFTSDYSKEELIQRWDEYTSVSRFAGADDRMDLIFVSDRKDNKIKLVRKARSAKEPFSSIFRGKIVENEQGSEIVGMFTKSVFDYLIAAAVIALIFYMRSYVMDNSKSLNAANTLLIFAIIFSVILLTNHRRSKRKYAEFISEITGKECKLFAPRDIFKKKNSD